MELLFIVLVIDLLKNKLYLHTVLGIVEINIDINSFSLTSITVHLYNCTTYTYDCGKNIFLCANLHYFSENVLDKISQLQRNMSLNSINNIYAADIYDILSSNKTEVYNSHWHFDKLSNEFSTLRFCKY